MSDREYWGPKAAALVAERDALVAEVERLRVLHKIDCEENEGLANDIGGWVKETNKLRALIGELVEELAVWVPAVPTAASALLDRARKAVGT